METFINKVSIHCTRKGAELKGGEPMFTIGAIGAGKKGMPILDAAVTALSLEPSSIVVYDLDPNRSRQARSRQFVVAGNEAEVYANSKILLLAIPSQIEVAESLLEKLACCKKWCPRHKRVVINVIHGVSSGLIKKYLGKDIEVINAVPTMGKTKGKVIFTHTSNTQDENLNIVAKIFAATGEFEMVSEPSLRKILSVDEYSQGYSRYFMEAIARAATEAGIEYNLAIRMVSRGFISAAEQILNSPYQFLPEPHTNESIVDRSVRHFEAKKVGNSISEGVKLCIKP